MRLEHERFILVGGVFSPTNGGLYCYAGNNPVRYVDPDGREIELEGTDTEKKALLEMINKYSLYKYKVDDSGKISRADNKKNGIFGIRKSEIYSKKLDIGIESKNKITISLSNTYKRKDGSIAFEDLDTESGGGATTGYKDDPSIINVTISPNGNAIERENAVRRQIGLPLRAKEKNHKCF